MSTDLGMFLGERLMFSGPPFGRPCAVHRLTPIPRDVVFLHLVEACHINWHK